MTGDPALPNDCQEAFELAMGDDFQSPLARERALSDAVETFREAIARAPRNARLWMYLGELELDRGATREARRAFREVLRLDPDDSMAHSGLAYACSQLGRHEEAERLLTHALGLDPSDVLYCQLGSLFIEQGRLDEADRVLRAGIELEPKNEELLFLLARFCSSDADEARELLERALAVEPDYIDALLELGALFASEEELERAERCFRRSIELAPDLADGYRELAAMRLPSDPTSALELSQLALDRDNDDPRTWTLFGESLWRLGDLEQAERSLLKACAIRPIDADGARAHWILARFYEERDRVADAIGVLRAGAPFAHAWPALAADLGRLLLEEGQLDEARRYLHVALEHDTDDRLSRELLRAVGP